MIAQIPQAAIGRREQRVAPRPQPLAHSLHHPIQHAARAARRVIALGHIAHLGHALHAARRGQQDQPLPRAGHAHVQQPRFLRLDLPRLLAGQRPPGHRVPGHAALGVHALEGQASLRVGAQQLPVRGHAEIARQLHQDDQRKLQPLGFVQRHDAHHIVVFAQFARRARIARAVGQIADGQKIMQRSPRAVCLRALAQQAQIGLPRRAIPLRPGQGV